MKEDFNDLLPPHTRGESVFVDDINEPKNVLHAVVFTSDIAHGKITKLDITNATKSKGVVKVLTATDIPGINQIGGIIQDEELLAEETVDFIGQPIAVILAETKENGKKAVEKIQVEYKELKPVFDPREAVRKGLLIAPSRTFTLGDVDATWSKCEHIIEGRVDSGGQEHLYLETQSAIAYPGEEKRITIYSATQSPTYVQRHSANVLGCEMNLIEVDVKRLGGAFGGKEDQATAWAVICALGTYHTNRPVKINLDRHEDMQVTGKRHPYSTDYKLGLDKEGKILAFEAEYYQDAGAAADLSTAILERTLFHVTNAYYIPNVRATGYSAKTNITPNTAFRGFGGPQAMFVIECALSKAADQVGIPKEVLQEKNLLVEGDQFPYGMHVKKSNARRSFKEALEYAQFEELKKKIDKYNSTHRFMKKGFSIMPICFGISFTSTFLNQAGALVHVYTDGSVSVSTAAVEMGQGVNMKLKSVASHFLSINVDRIRIESTNTTRIANTSPTAASSGADLNGKAVEIACSSLIERLKNVAAEKLGLDNVEFINEVVCKSNGEETELKWEQLIDIAYKQRVNLSSHAFYATPKIHFSREEEKGEPFAYHVFGTAITEVIVDCLRGRYFIDRVHIVHDAGKSINELIDRGQVEGGLVQGIGWMTLEELMWNEKGKLCSNNLATYKVPDLHFSAFDMNIKFLEDAENPHAVMKSKAIGEPPFMYGIGTYFALKDAARSFNDKKEWKYTSPLTPERLLLYLYELDEINNEEIGYCN